MISRNIGLSLALLCGVAALSCRFQDLTPGSSRREEAALQAATTLFYHALAHRDTAELARAALPAATALVAGTGAQPVLVPLVTMVMVDERRNEDGGVRVVRTEVHADSDVATDRIVVMARGQEGTEDFEASDWLTFARRDGAWRVAHAVFGPWRNRTAQ
ncbi:MAG: nuclear transport factor 2 family protein [Gemmatimonadales bacterium]